MKSTEKEKLLLSIGAKLMAYAKNELCLEARYLAGAAGYAEELDCSELSQNLPIRSMSTNGTLLVYNSDRLLRMFERGSCELVRTYTHLLFHCIYRHYAKQVEKENPLAWDTACDMAAEYMVDELQASCTKTEGEDLRQSYYALYKQKCAILTAEHLYEEMRFLSDLELKELRKVFERDDHQLWRQAASQAVEGQRSTEAPDNEDGRGSEAPDGERSGDVKELTEKEGDYGESNGLGIHALRGSDREGMRTSGDAWKRIAERIKLDIESFSEDYGDKTANLCRTIDVELRTRYDYRLFLRRFMTLKEILKEDPSEFDYIYYNLGLTMYGNVPLLDSLEYALDYSLEEFVVAVDTSGSVFNDLVVRFLEECYAVISQAQTARRRVDLHIIQCDCAVKEDAVITGYDDFVRYIKRFHLRGGGGTDFRPVFERVKELRKQGKLSRLKGMIYFTDGKGRYPEKPPDFDVAFVFYGTKGNDFDVPPWAVKLVIDERDAQSISKAKSV